MRGNAWRKLSKALAVSVEHDFERKVLPVLRLIWPSIDQVPSKRHWDSQGIDLVTWTEHASFPCVVQCKGFHVRELGADQARQVEKSINGFHNSDISCDTYLIVHNRDGRHEQFNRRVEKRLEQLVVDGRAKRAELWDRQKTLNEAYNRMQELLSAALREHSQNLLSYFQSLFEFGYCYNPVVPVAEKKLIFKRGEPCTSEEIHVTESHDIGKVLLSPSDTRWTLLTGGFGTGKTTAVLQAATSSDQIVIFVRCSALPGSILIPSTNVLLSEAAKSLRILEEFDDESRELIYKTAGPALVHLLKDPESSYILILDGLDENRRYTSLKGLQYLSNQLADLNCPVIMTTRIEHLGAMFGNFSLAFHEFSTKKGPKRDARLLELAQWKKNQVIQLINRILAETTGQKQERISEFLKVFNSGEYVDLYGELPYNPLFLRFILEDVINHGVRLADRSLLLRSWVKRKIWRDREVNRVSPDDSMDVDDSTDRIFRLMENVANRMTIGDGNNYELTEFTDSETVKQEAKDLFITASENQILGILLNSVLMPCSVRRGSHLSVTFVFRIFHEFFLASYLVRENLQAEGYPDTVKSFYSEISKN